MVGAYGGVHGSTAGIEPERKTPATPVWEQVLMADEILLGMTSPAGPDVLMPVLIEGEEAISAPFLFRVSMVSPTADLAADSMLDQSVTVTVSGTATGMRYFNGVVRRFSQLDRTRGGEYAYSLEMVPKFWFTSRTIDCRIFHNMTSKDILEQVLGDNSVTSEVRPQGTPASRPYTVQYNESDFDFLSRLMEEEGYYYWFEHADGSHKMIITDNTHSAVAVPAGTMLIDSGMGGISSWRREQTVATGSSKLWGYNAKEVSIVSGETKTVLKASDASTRDHNIWPARTRLSATATARSRIRQEAADAFAVLREGASQNANFVPGGKFTVEAGPLESTDAGDYILRSVTHRAQDSARAQNAAASGYSNQFTAFPAATTWRQPLVTPRPDMAGVHVALVLGLSGEEIHVSDEGRITVRFYWDWRQDATAENTIEVRVMHPWAGNGWGVQHIPRVGTEVCVAFINGDPDDPVVIGQLYNGTNKHPYDPSANPTISGIRTRSSKGGGASDFNEFYFDDKKGNELVALWAQKDHTVSVENDQTVHIMHDQKITVDNDRTRLVKNDETVTVKNNQTITVTQNRTVEISQGNEVLTVKTGNMTTSVDTGNQSNTVKTGNQSNTVKTGNITEEASMGNISQTAKMGNITTEASLGNISIKAALGAVTVEAMQSIELKVGMNSVKIDQMGVTIKGMMVKIEGQIMTDVKGLMTTVTGTAMNQVKGGIVMIGP
jgi:type VI secretion system secreted protein VgrG